MFCAVDAVAIFKQFAFLLFEKEEEMEEEKEEKVKQQIQCCRG